MAQAALHNAPSRGTARLVQRLSAVSPATAYAFRFSLVVAAAIGIGKLPGKLFIRTVSNVYCLSRQTTP